VTRGVDDLLADLADAADAAAELEAWEGALGHRAPAAPRGRGRHRPTGRHCHQAAYEVIKATPEIPWREVKGMRIIAAHAYHRIDYEEVWVTLRDDVPRMDQAIKHWRQTQP
jgi:hypothetical protein